MVLKMCRRYSRSCCTVVFVLSFFLCASLIKITKVNDVQICNVLEVSPVTRLDTNVSKATRSPEPHLDHTKPRIVIVLAYMHTGSSYTAGIIHQHPGTFYEFEPLRSIQATAHDGRQLVLLNGSQRQYNRTLKIPTVDPNLAAWLVHSVATCNHRQLDVGTLSNFFFGVRNNIYRDYVPYINCVANGRSDIAKGHVGLLPQSLLDIRTVNKCVPLMEKLCGKATIRLAKYIRLSVEAVLKVVQKVDNVRVIHLVRDPRAMMDSELRKNDLNVRGSFSMFVQRTRDMCLRMKRDLHLVAEMKDKLSHVLRTWRYEDLSDHPMATAKELFEFIEEDFGPEFEKFVTDRSIKSMKNSTVRQAKWRSHISLRHLQTVDQYCSFLYDQLGYIPLSSIEEVRNLTNKDHI